MKKDVSLKKKKLLKLKEIAEKRLKSNKIGGKIKPLIKKKVSKKIKSKVNKKSVKRKTEKKKSMQIINKHKENPVISPNDGNGWEAWQTFNPAAILIDGQVHLLYRAIGHDSISRLGHAFSEDGFKFEERFPDPVYEHSANSGKYVCYSIASGGSWGGCEDPRIVRVGDEDKLYITYTACDGGLRVGLTSIKLEDFKNKKWNWSRPQLISPPGEVHKNWVIFPEKINGKYAILHSISPKLSIEYLDSLDDISGHIKSHYSPGKIDKKRWDSFLRGPGPPPIKTKHGWLLFYHAMNHKSMDKYKLGAMLLDLNDPTKILHRSKEPVLIPQECYEIEGFKPGVVYALGAVIKEGDLIIYYGGADSHVCVAHVNFEKFLKALTKEKKKLPKLEVLKKKKG